MDEDDAAARDALSEVDGILRGASDAVSVEAAFSIFIRVGAMLKVWRRVMTEEGGYSEAWVEAAAWDILQLFFNRYPKRDNDRSE